MSITLVLVLGIVGFCIFFIILPLICVYIKTYQRSSVKIVPNVVNESPLNNDEKVSVGNVKPENIENPKDCSFLSENKNLNLFNRDLNFDISFDKENYTIECELNGNLLPTTNRILTTQRKLLLDSKIYTQNSGEKDQTIIENKDSKNNNTNTNFTRIKFQPIETSKPIKNDHQIGAINDKIESYKEKIFVKSIDQNLSENNYSNKNNNHFVEKLPLAKSSYESSPREIKESFIKHVKKNKIPMNYSELHINMLMSGVTKLEETNFNINSRLFKSKFESQRLFKLKKNRSSSKDTKNHNDKISLANSDNHLDLKNVFHTQSFSDYYQNSESESALGDSYTKIRSKSYDNIWSDTYNEGKICYDKWSKSYDFNVIKEYRKLGHFNFLLVDKQKNYYKIGLKNDNKWDLGCQDDSKSCQNLKNNINPRPVRIRKRTPCQNNANKRLELHDDFKSQISDKNMFNITTFPLENKQTKFAKTGNFNIFSDQNLNQTSDDMLIVDKYDINQDDDQKYNSNFMESYTYEWQLPNRKVSNSDQNIFNNKLDNSNQENINSNQSDANHNSPIYKVSDEGSPPVKKHKIDRLNSQEYAKDFNITTTKIFSSSNNFLDQDYNKPIVINKFNHKFSVDSNLSAARPIKTLLNNGFNSIYSTNDNSMKSNNVNIILKSSKENEISSVIEYPKEEDEKEHDAVIVQQRHIEEKYYKKGMLKIQL